MLVFIFKITLFLIFLILSLIHFNWAIGGEWALEKTSPTKTNGDKVLNPKTFDCIVVGVVLFSFALFYLAQTILSTYNSPNWTCYFSWIIPLIFLLRAVGDFKYIGFFKRVNDTVFAKWDGILFSPLCLGISFIGFLIAFLS